MNLLVSDFVPQGVFHFSDISDPQFLSVSAVAQGYLAPEDAPHWIEGATSMNGSTSLQQSQGSIKDSILERRRLGCTTGGDPGTM
ncbi:hypothetical protein CSKR_107073 [Clonorchis sinensis]|uniref:Uncharacterized protein n=1 Tax=Clonorchis sinensis TaxID=79923 RepID=A0A419PDB1_CLOSI|nr:hypothetical protein CSKR_107073 [Clonorchis sinensis]